MDSNKPPLASARASLAELLARDSGNTKSMSPTKHKKRFGVESKDISKTKAPESKRAYVPSINLYQSSDKANDFGNKTQKISISTDYDSKPLKKSITTKYQPIKSTFL